VVGDLRRETVSPEEDLSPSVSLDGSTAVYFSGPPMEGSLNRKDLATGKTTAYGRMPGAANRLEISPDGASAVFRILEGASDPKPQAIHSVDLATGKRVRICPDCGAPTQVSPDGRMVLFETGSATTQIAAWTMATATKSVLLRHSHHSAQGARISPDGRWIVFHLNRGFDGFQVFVARFRGPEATPMGEWLAVTDAAESSFEPAWSSDGRFIYYLHRHRGRTCVAMRSFDAQTGRVGPEGGLLHLHDARLTPLAHLRRPPHYVGLSAGRGRLVLSLAEVGGSIWLADFR
jgi:Tol biopolymer transport system component